jgi:methionyl-tRNA formyltransferase
VITVAPQVALPLIEGLRALGHEVTGLLTAPTPRKPENLEQILAESTVETHVARDVRHATELLCGFDADLAICSGFPRKLPAEAVTAPRLGILNGHPSLLPRWRGPNPFGWTFRAGDEVLGFTWHLMDAELDTGPIVEQGSTPLTDDDGVHTLFELMPPLAGGLLPGALARLQAGDRGDPQQTEGATWAPLFEDEYAEIDWGRPAREVHNQIRCWFLPTPKGLLGAHTTLERKRVKVTRSQLVDGEFDAAPPGTIVAREDGALLVQCGDRPLRVLETEPA